jgi:hypothetical protein
MAVTIDTIKRLSATSIELYVSSDISGAVFYVWKNADLVCTSQGNRIVVSISSGETPVISVFDSATEKPENIFPSRITLGWYKAADTETYRIEKYSGSEWVNVAEVKDISKQFYIWKSEIISDGEEVQFRIIPVGRNGNDGTAKVFNVLMVRVPDVPDVNYSYSSSTQKITITEA